MPACSRAKDEEICRVCWPGGWPEGHVAAGCEHGEYARSEEAAKPPEQPSAAPPEQPPAE
jgi:hypothetical protein